MQVDTSYTKVFAITSVIVFSTISSKAQDKTPPMQTDRPDQTESPYTVPVRHFQVESGYNYEKVSNSESNQLYPTILWKYGLNKNFEFRLITELANNKLNTSTSTGFNPVVVGFKVKLSEEKGILPKTSFIGHLYLPTISGKDFRSTYYAPQFKFCMQHSLSERVSLSYNLGGTWNGTTAEPAFLYTISCGYSITDKLGTYIEAYGFAPQQRQADHRADGGFTYFVLPNLMFDVSGGIGITANAPRHYFSFGCSFRLPN